MSRKNLTKKPNVKHNPKHSVSTNTERTFFIPKDEQKINKDYLLKHIDMVQKRLEDVLGDFEGNAVRYSVSSNNSEVKDAVGYLTRNGNKNISYPVYLKSLTKDGSTAKLVQSVYEDKSIGLWGNYSVKVAKLLNTSNKELEHMKTFLYETDIQESSTYSTLMQNINVVRSITEESDSLKQLKLSKASIKKSYEASTKEELIGTQAILNEQMTSIGDNLKRNEAIFKSSVLDTAPYYYTNVAGKSISRKLKATNTGGVIGSIVNGFKSAFEKESAKAEKDFENRATIFSEQSVKILDSLREVATIQIQNQAIVELGGAEEIDISDVYRDKPDEEILKAVSEELTGIADVTPTISGLAAKDLNDIREELAQFVAVEDFESLKDNIYFGDTVEIDGGNIHAGTIEAGALKIGFRPLKTDIRFRAGVLDDVSEVPASEPWPLSHTAGYIQTYNSVNEITTFTIPESAAGGVLTDTSEQPTVAGGPYFIFAILNDDGTGTIALSQTNQEDGEYDPGVVVTNLGMYFLDGTFPRVILSYGSTVINGAEIVTGSITADQIKAGSITVGELDPDIKGDLGVTTTFKQTTIPTSTAVGDIWYDTDDNMKMYRAASIGADAITTGEWELVAPPLVTRSVSAPLDPRVNDVWVDISRSAGNNYADITKVWDGDSWEIASTVHYPGTTKINGGLIETETITATSISAGAITADKITLANRDFSMIGKFVPNSSTGTNISNGHLYYPGGDISLKTNSGWLIFSLAAGDKVAAPAQSSKYWIYVDFTGTTTNGIFTPTSAVISSSLRTASSPLYGLPADTSTHQYKKIGTWTTAATTIFGTLALDAGETVIDGSNITTGKLNADIVNVTSTTSKTSMSSSGLKVNDGTIDRVIVGKTGTTSYGINVFNDYGKKIFDTEGLSDSISLYSNMGVNNATFSDLTLINGGTGKTAYVPDYWEPRWDNGTSTGEAPSFKQDSAGSWLYPLNSESQETGVRLYYPDGFAGLTTPSMMKQELTWARGLNYIPNMLISAAFEHMVLGASDSIDMFAWYECETVASGTITLYGTSAELNVRLDYDSTNSGTFSSFLGGMSQDDLMDEIVSLKICFRVNGTYTGTDAGYLRLYNFSVQPTSWMNKFYGYETNASATRGQYSTTPQMLYPLTSTMTVNTSLATTTGTVKTITGNGLTYLGFGSLKTGDIIEVTGRSRINLAAGTTYNLYLSIYNTGSTLIEKFLIGHNIADTLACHGTIKYVLPGDYNDVRVYMQTLASTGTHTIYGQSGSADTYTTMTGWVWRGNN